MASFDAQIKLTADSTPVERSVRKIEKKLDNVSTATKKILEVDKQILSTRRQLIGLSGKAEDGAKKTPPASSPSTSGAWPTET
nr:hypothetical protein 1 [bacterium]